MNCPRCNEPVEPGAVFCGNCGQSLQQTAASQPMARPAANFGPPPSRAAPSGPMTRASFNDVAPARPATPVAAQPQQPFGPPQSAPIAPAAEDAVPAPVPQSAQPASAPFGPAAASAPASAPFGPSAGSQSPSPVAAALQNAAATSGPAPMPTPSQPGLGNQGSVAAMPSYAVANPGQHKAETKAIIGLVLSILALSGALVPVLGIVLAIAGVVLSSIARSGLRKKLLSTLAFIFAGIGVAVSIGAYVYYYQAIKKEQASASTTSSQTAPGATDAAAVGSEDQAVDNPCFSMTTVGMTDVTATSTVCKVEASDGKKSTTAKNALIVESLTQSSANASNLAQLGQAMTDNYVKSSIPGLVVSSQKTGTFAGSPAYLIHGSKDGIAMDMALVLHPTAHGENLFLVITTSQDDQNVSISKFEKDWKWK